MASGETSLQMRRSSALLDDIGALEDRGAHRESSGWERGVQGGFEAQVDGGGNGWRERRMRVRWNPGESRPKSEIHGTYRHVGSWRSSRSRRRRGLGTGAADCRAAVASFERRLEKGEREALGWGLYRPGVLRGWKGSGARGRDGALSMHERRWLDLPCMATPLTGGGRKGSRKEKEGEGRGRRAADRRGQVAARGRESQRVRASESAALKGQSGLGR